MDKRLDPICRIGAAIVAAVVLIGLMLVIPLSWAQIQPPDQPRPLASLKGVPVPEPPNLADFVRDKAAAIQLGKALFWDMQVGSDGTTACASCHVQAGADRRTKNQLSPGLLARDTTFKPGWGPNYTLWAGDFPFTRHGADPDNPATPISADTNDVASSQGVFRRDFLNVSLESEGHVLVDLCTQVADQVFHVGGINTRQVAPRNAPTNINAVFNFRSLWNGQANNDFNGVNPFGQRDPNARVWKADPLGNLEQVAVVIPFSSLASLAVGPPLNFSLMSCRGRTWPKIGQKLLAPDVVPLRRQRLDPDDSVLGAIANRNHGTRGLSISYADLIRRAFQPVWWQAETKVTVGGGEFTQMEANFSLFFGLAVQLYQATLIADDTLLDRVAAGVPGAAFTPAQQAGLAIFVGQGRCIQCHSGPELTNAAVANVVNQRLELMVMGDGGCRIYDNGFYNIGARPTAEDVGVGGADPFGNPLSETEMFLQGKLDLPHPVPQPDCAAPTNEPNVMGAMKTPGLRNVELTGPYFHNGGKATLRQVVQFYNRGGDFAAANSENLDPDIQPLNLTPQQQDELVDFLLALTDERVRFQKAPFDHPELCIPNGHKGDQTAVIGDSDGEAKDKVLCIKALGAAGATAPLQPFLHLNPHMPELPFP